MPVDPVKLMLGVANKGLLPLAFAGRDEGSLLPYAPFVNVETIPYSPRRCSMRCDWCGREMAALVRRPAIRGNHNDFWRDRPSPDDIYVCSEFCGESLANCVIHLR